MFLESLGVSYFEPLWSLHQVLALLSSNPFNINISFENLTLKTNFLLGLALGGRASELHSTLRSGKFLVFAVTLLRLRSFHILIF